MACMAGEGFCYALHGIWEERMSDVIDWSKGAAWMRGEVVPIADATIGVTDWGVTRSDITYDVVPVWEGGFFRLEDYLDRFEASMASLRLEVGMSRDDIRAALHQMVARSGLRAAYVAMVASRGVPLIHVMRDPRQCANHFYAWCVPYVHVVKPEIAEKAPAYGLPRKCGAYPRTALIRGPRTAIGAISPMGCSRPRIRASRRLSCWIMRGM